MSPPPLRLPAQELKGALLPAQELNPATLLDLFPAHGANPRSLDLFPAHELRDYTDHGFKHPSLLGFIVASIT